MAEHVFTLLELVVVLKIYCVAGQALRLILLGLLAPDGAPALRERNLNWIELGVRMRAGLDQPRDVRLC